MQAETPSEKEFRYSPYLRNTKNAVFADYLKDEEQKLLSLRANLEKQAETSERAKESLKDVDEKLSIASTKRTWEFLLEVLKRSK